MTKEILFYSNQNSYFSQDGYQAIPFGEEGLHGLKVLMPESACSVSTFRGTFIRVYVNGEGECIGYIDDNYSFHKIGQNDGNGSIFNDGAKIRMNDVGDRVFYVQNGYVYMASAADGYTSTMLAKLDQYYDTYYVSGQGEARLIYDFTEGNELVVLNSKGTELLRVPYSVGRKIDLFDWEIRMTQFLGDVYWVGSNDVLYRTNGSEEPVVIATGVRALSECCGKTLAYSTEDNYYITSDGENFKPVFP